MRHKVVRVVRLIDYSNLFTALKTIYLNIVHKNAPPVRLLNVTANRAGGVWQGVLARGGASGCWPKDKCRPLSGCGIRVDQLSCAPWSIHEPIKSRSSWVIWVMLPSGMICEATLCA